MIQKTVFPGKTFWYCLWIEFTGYMQLYHQISLVLNLKCLPLNLLRNLHNEEFSFQNSNLQFKCFFYSRKYVLNFSSSICKIWAMNQCQIAEDSIITSQFCVGKLCSNMWLQMARTRAQFLERFNSFARAQKPHPTPSRGE